MQTITWDLPKLTMFRDSHRHALSSGFPSFIFQGHEFDTRYAGYLAEYVAGELGGVKAKRDEKRTPSTPKP